MFKFGDFVRILCYDKKDINAKGIVQYVREDGKVVVSNMNMPFSGTLAMVPFDKQQLRKI